MDQAGPACHRSCGFHPEGGSWAYKAQLVFGLPQHHFTKQVKVRFSTGWARHQALLTFFQVNVLILIHRIHCSHEDPLSTVLMRAPDGSTGLRAPTRRPPRLEGAPGDPSSQAQPPTSCLDLHDHFYCLWVIHKFLQLCLVTRGEIFQAF